MVEAVADRSWHRSARKPTRCVLDQLSRREVRPYVRVLGVLDADVPGLSIGARYEVLARMIGAGMHVLHTFASVVCHGDAVLVDQLAAHVTGLRILSVSQSLVSNGGARAIAESPAFANLERLSLHSNAIDDNGADALVGSPHLAGLRYLNLYENRISTDAIARIRARPAWHATKLILHRQG